MEILVETWRVAATYHRVEKQTSARKTLIETLLHSDVPPTSVMQLTGHKNVQSLNSYSSLSVDQQESMSRAISKHIAGSSDLEDNDNSITMPLSPALQSQLVNEFAMDMDAETNNLLHQHQISQFSNQSQISQCNNQYITFTYKEQTLPARLPLTWANEICCFDKHLNEF